MIELAGEFPSSQVLERLAASPEISAHELFAVPASPEDALERLSSEILNNINLTVCAVVEEAFRQRDEKLSGNENRTPASAGT